jgi:hypothetical protein
MMASGEHPNSMDHIAPTPPRFQTGEDVVGNPASTLLTVGLSLVGLNIGMPQPPARP